MTAGLEGIGTAFWMTAKTYFLLLEGIENPVSCAVDLVAGSAAQLLDLVPASKPGQPPSGFVTVQANLILRFYRCFRIGAKGIHGQHIQASLLGEHVILSGSVTGFTLQPGKWRSGVCA
jgi:hypothetical protein